MPGLESLEMLRRWVVVGTTSSGKSTLARALAARLGLPHVELDALFWGPDWRPVAETLFKQRVREAVQADGWVVDGNYGLARDLVWPQAQAAIWLDYPLRLVLWQLLRRSLGRMIRREVLWGTNRESPRLFFFSRRSLFLWALSSHPRRKRQYPLLFQSPLAAHLQVLRFRSPAAAGRWLASLPAAGTAQP